MVYSLLLLCLSIILADFFKNTLAKSAYLAKIVDFLAISKTIYALQAK